MKKCRCKISMYSAVNNYKKYDFIKNDILSYEIKENKNCLFDKNSYISTKGESKNKTDERYVVYFNNNKKYIYYKDTFNEYFTDLKEERMKKIKQLNDNR